MNRSIGFAVVGHRPNGLVFREAFVDGERDILMVRVTILSCRAVGINGFEFGQREKLFFESFQVQAFLIEVWQIKKIITGDAQGLAGLGELPMTFSPLAVGIAIGDTDNVPAFFLLSQQQAGEKERLVVRVCDDQ